MVRFSHIMGVAQIKSTRTGGSDVASKHNRPPNGISNYRRPIRVFNNLVDVIGSRLRAGVIVMQRRTERHAGIAQKKNRCNSQLPNFA